MPLDLIPLLVTSLIGKPSSTNSPLVQILLTQGAIVYCKTIVSEIMRV